MFVRTVAEIKRRIKKLDFKEFVEHLEKNKEALKIFADGVEKTLGIDFFIKDKGNEIEKPFAESFGNMYAKRGGRKWETR